MTLPQATSPPYRTRGQRRGYSLIELLLAVAIVSVVLSGLAIAMQVLVRIDRQLKDDAAYAHIVPRLSLQLRADAHAANDMAILDGANRPAGVPTAEDQAAGRPRTETTGMMLTLPYETIEYHAVAGRVTRTRRRDGVELGKEVFALGKQTRLQWRKIEAPSPLMELEIARARGRIDSDDARRVDRIVAAVGLRTRREQEGDSDVRSE